MIADREMLEAFLSEGRDLVGRAADDLAALGREAGETEAVDRLFRSLHTLKGSAALFDLPVLTALLHAAETRLELVRAGGEMQEALGVDITGALDVTEAWLDLLEAGAEPGAGLLAMAAGLTARLEGAGTASPADEQVAASGQTLALPDWVAAFVQRQGVHDAVTAVLYRPDSDAYFRGDDPVAIVRALPGLRALEIELAQETADTEGQPYDPFRCRLVARALSDAPEAQTRAALRLVADQADVFRLSPPVMDPGEPSPARAAEQTLRVSAARLDDVAALVDELVIARNALEHAAALVAAVAPPGPQLRELALRQATLQRLVGDLHGAVTDLRLVSLRGLFTRFPRHIREAAARLGKAIDFRTDGEDTALDKTAVDALFEPLLHLLRNAVDHGVETADARRAAGKSDTARVRLAARQAGEAVIIEVSDDGRGLDPDALRARAAERGLLEAAAAERLSDAEAADLIFAAGFSTARQVGEFSGRGVGMDSVRAALTQLGGRVDLDNRPGAGLTVRLTLPARMVLTRVLVVQAGGERFGVVMEAVNETHRVRADEVTPIRAGRAYVRRDEVIPILRLRSLLGLEEAADPPVFPVLTVDAGSGAVGVQVDAVSERIEAPLRPLDGLMKGFPGLVGSMLQGDGRILLVLDLAEMAA